MTTRYHILVTQEVVPSEHDPIEGNGLPPAVAKTRLLSFRTEHKPDLGAITTMLSKEPKKKRSDAGTTRTKTTPAA